LIKFGQRAQIFTTSCAIKHKMKNPGYLKERFVFVNLSVKSGYVSGINHGIAYLVPILRKYDYEPYILNIRSEISVKEFMRQINVLDPSIVGFSCLSNQLIYLKKYSESLQNKKTILQIAGGVCPTLEPETVLSFTSVKGVCVGEGEKPLDNLFSRIRQKQNLFDTEGFYWKNEKEITKNVVPSFVADLSTLDFPDYSVFDNFLVCNNSYLLVMLSRGCPYSCSYCCNDAKRSIYRSSAKYFRVPSVEYAISLIEKLVAQYPKAKFIQLEDDLLIANKDWFESFAEQYAKKIKIPYKCCVRTEYITPDIAKAMKSSGCMQAMIGLESGNEYLRNNLLNRKYSNDLFIEKTKILKDEGIELFVFNIVGFPFETAAQMQDTLNLNKQISPDYGVCTFFYPYKGTELYSLCERDGLLKSEKDARMITNYNTRPAIKLTNVKENECIYFQRRITNYLVWQFLLSKYKKFAISHSPFKKIVYFVYLWFDLYIKRRLSGIVHNSPILYAWYSKVKYYLYGKK